MSLQDYYEKESRPYHDPSWWTVWKNFLSRVGGWLLMIGLLVLLLKSIVGSETFRKVRGFLARVEVKK